MERYKFSNRRNLVKYCPCGKNNRDGKFAPFDGYTEHGYCHSCCKPFFPNNGTIVEPFDIKDKEKFERPKYYYSPELVERTELGINQNNFHQYLKTVFPEDKVNEVAKKYRVGTWKNGESIYWEIDQQGKVHFGNVMGYDQKTGKRSFKANGEPDITSMRACLKYWDYENSRCLFGLHLINEKTEIVALVEAAKTAEVMCLFKPEYEWLATRNKGGFTEELLEPIKHCRIVAFPDKGAYDFWLQKAIELNKKGFRIKVDDWLEGCDCPDNTDLADIYLENEEKKSIRTKLATDE